MSMCSTNGHNFSVTLRCVCGVQNRGDGLDMNVYPVWLQGYTGRDVVVSILDDGIEKDHPDIKKNYARIMSCCSCI